MKHLSVLCLSFCLCLSTWAQNELEKANTCYDKKDYNCAIDNYKIALDKKLYQDGQRHLVESRIGNGYFRMEMYDKAIEYLKRSINTNGNYMNSNWVLADSYYNTGNDQDAVYYYKKAYDLATNDKDKDVILYWKSKANYQLKRYADAIADLKRVRSRDGDLIYTESTIGDQFYAQANYDSAIFYYQRSLTNLKTTDPTYTSVLCFIGKCYRLLDKPDQAMKQQDAALSNDPNYGAAMWEKGVLFYNKKEYAKAIDWYKKALPTYEKAGDSASRYTLLNNIAFNYRYLGNYAEAVNWHLQSRPFAKNRYAVSKEMATLQYGKLKKPADVEKTCISAINEYALEPYTVKDLYKVEMATINAILGKKKLKEKDTTNALRYFEEAIKLKFSNYLANEGAADIAWARKDNNALKRHFTNLYKWDYDTLLNTKAEIANVWGRSAYVDAMVREYQPSVYSSSVYSGLALDSLQKQAVALWPRILVGGTSSKLEKERNACISLLRRAIKQYAADKPYVSEAYNAIAVLTVSTDTAAVHKALDEAVKFDPENMSAWDNTLKFCNSYDYKRGIQVADKLIAMLKKKKDNATLSIAQIYKGDFLWKMDKKDEARVVYKEALASDPNSATAKDRAKL